MEKTSYVYGIAILHYKALDETIQCINSLLEFVNNFEMHITVVDNGSLDGSGEKIRQKYINNKNIHIIISDKNLGFAKGMNIGYLSLRNKKCDFIILLNSDVVILQKNFFLCIANEYKEKDFDILGPQILDSKGNVIRSNPQYAIHNTVYSVYIGQAMCLLKWLLSFIKIDELLEKFLSILQNSSNKLSPYQSHENIQINGCCIVFSSNYIKKFKEGLNSNTFMYLEEEILYHRARKSSMKIIYSPNLQIIHYGEASTKKQIGSSKAKIRRFRYLNQFKSFFILKKEIQQKSS